MADNFELKILDSGVALLYFDLSGKSVNVLNEEVMKELDEIISSQQNNSSIKSLVILSRKKNIFIAGADIEEIRNLTESNDASKKAREGQLILDRLNHLPFPTVAAIDGACLGGGFELALSCNYRIASDNPKTQIGLPEVTLGILPGFGGTQRLPRLIGLIPAVDMILSGKTVDARKAYKLKIADDYFTAEFFEKNAIAFAEKIADLKFAGIVTARRKLPIAVKLQEFPLIRDLIFSKVRKTTLEKTKGKYPAPLACIELIRETFPDTLETGLKKEAGLFGQLAVTEVCKNLIHIFYVNEELKKFTGVPEGTPIMEINRAGVIGGGIMGSGIAWLMSYRNIPVRIKEISIEALQKAVSSAHDIYNQLMKIRKIKPNEAVKKMHNLTISEDYKGFKDKDIVIEAVIEKKDLKLEVYSELEKVMPEKSIIASNTSSISISELQNGLKNPSRFVGMHFFNPVNRMPLVEVIPGEKTSKETIASTVNFAKKLGKTPVVVKSCPGFLVNRILMPYLNEAALILEDGESIERVDKIILDFGMPMGPFTLLDEIGLDVSYKVAHILESAYGDRMKCARLLETISREKDLLGKKSGKGFYIHKGKKKYVNSEIYKFAEKSSESKFTDDIIRDRCILIMVNEAALCIEERVAAKPSHLDMAMIMGTGFPPFRGGLLKYADNRGLNNIVMMLNNFADQFGSRFKPAPLLSELSEIKRKFYTD